MKYSFADAAKGFLVYGAGDAIASGMLEEFSIPRLLVMAGIGASLYAFEVPNYFQWISRISQSTPGWRSAIKKGLLAVAYFNPIWIARHMLFIRLSMWKLDGISWNLLQIASWSFLANLPVSLIVNYFIQNQVHYKHRFMASAIFSGLMAIYYAASIHWFA